MKIQPRPDQKPVHQALLPIPLKNNNTGQGWSHWGPAAERKSAERIIRAIDQVREPFEFPVVIHVTRVLGKGQRTVDPDSILRGNFKGILDSLVACGWFVDDSARYIAGVYGFQTADYREHGPSTLVEIYDSRECVASPIHLYGWQNPIEPTK